jgi:hypothetical protein
LAVVGDPSLKVAVADTRLGFDQEFADFDGTLESGSGAGEHGSKLGVDLLS